MEIFLGKQKLLWLNFTRTRLDAFEKKKKEVSLEYYIEMFNIHITII
jgi:hypothetical protein